MDGIESGICERIDSFEQLYEDLSRGYVQAVTQAFGKTFGDLKVCMSALRMGMIVSVISMI